MITSGAKPQTHGRAHSAPPYPAPISFPLLIIHIGPSPNQILESTWHCAGAELYFHYNWEIVEVTRAQWTSSTIAHEKLYTLHMKSSTHCTWKALHIAQWKALHIAQWTSSTIAHEKLYTLHNEQALHIIAHMTLEAYMLLTISITAINFLPWYLYLYL